MTHVLALAYEHVVWDTLLAQFKSERPGKMTQSLVVYFPSSFHQLFLLYPLSLYLSISLSISLSFSLYLSLSLSLPPSLSLALSLSLSLFYSMVLLETLALTKLLHIVGNMYVTAVNAKQGARLLIAYVLHNNLISLTEISWHSLTVYSPKSKLSWQWNLYNQCHGMGKTTERWNKIKIN